MRSLLTILAVLPIFSLTSALPAAEQTVEKSTEAARHAERTVAGWKVLIHPDLTSQATAATEEALTLLEGQLSAIVKDLPASVVARLREVPLWFSPRYPGIGPRAEYHPGAGWLRDNGRNPAMEKAIEFTNIPEFAAETRRMPNFALHELAHAYHDRVLGFDNPEIIDAYDAARTSGKYNRVKRRDSEGREREDKAYAMTDHKEYFAECTEAFFSRNDFFPFVRAELEAHDPRAVRVLARTWNADPLPAITAPPAGMKLPPFYTKYISASGYPIIASDKVSDYALREAAFLCDQMLAKRPDIRDAMIRSGSRMNVIAWNEFTTDLPDFAMLQPKNFWDARARGTGGSEDDPACSSAEENLLGYPGDPYEKECILIHEFAHSIHLRGVQALDPTFNDRLRATYDKAKAAGLWKNAYAATNPAEYFAEGVQSWFNNNRENDSVHNHVNTRRELEEYDPGLAAICREIFGDTELRYTKAPTRPYGHLAGFDPSKAPTFTWPERLRGIRDGIKRDAEKRD
jgi:Mlc titration factor MtfA (ptsG expression regulator)